MRMSDRKHSRDLQLYNRWAATYEDSKAQDYRRVVHENLLNWLEEAHIAPKRVLDVGCGTGALLRRVAERFPDAELVGVDVAENMIKVARAKAHDGFPGQFLQAPAEKLPFEADEFDLVLSSICFHHWRSRSEGIAEISRVLRSGGYVCIADHFAIGWLRVLFTIGRSRDRIHTPSELRKMFAEEDLLVRDWRLLNRLLRLPFIHAVLAQRV
jgi:ubiquinone/menaquinone biosynthesis C-methylase UbiE